MNVREIKEIIEVFKEAGIEEFEIEKEGMKIRLKRGMGTTAEITRVVEKQVSELPKEKLEEKVKKEIKPPDNLVEITTPMVGTFYRAPSPESPPYVQEGDVVSENQVLCIIEAMKLMNEIKAEMKCKIVKILIENGQPVEFNQPIFLVEPLK